MNHLISRYFSLILILIFVSFLSCQNEKEDIDTSWPEFDRVAKPWTRWWWQGSAVTKEGITSELESLKEAGIGGVEITPIYGVIGEEDQFIDYLSEDWMDMLIHTLHEADRLGLGVDMATGTGWPFGGPWVEKEHTSKNMVYKTYSLKGGEKLNEPIKYIQESMLRSISNPVYQEHINADPESSLSIDQLKEPISSNADMQGLAIDQVRFETRLPLVTVMAYSDSGENVNLTDKVDSNGDLQWTAPEGEWQLYAVFQGWHGKMVERAAPGGEGYVIDHFSKEALDDYLAKFDSAFSGRDISSLRAFFNDSYEVDDARGEANWTDGFFDEFKKRRGYDLRDYLPALFGNDEEEINTRVLIDYRETIADLLYENFTLGWHKWAQENNALVRNQSHGSPANILDLYAAIDIPETEGDEILKIKFASSAANVTGKYLSSSESATWLDEHFRSNLADVRKNLDRYLLGGINHVFYHGTAYSPDEAEWPGWLFYAAIHANDRNPWWDDFSTLNQYITRIQSFMQKGKADNDILLYFPIYDRYAHRGGALLEHFDIRGEFNDSEVKKIGDELWKKGYSFDFISDKQISQLSVEGGSLNSAGLRYKTIVIPETGYIPLETFKKLMALANEGATVIFHRELPASVPGLEGLENKLNEFEQLKSELSFNGDEAKANAGLVLKGEELDQLLSNANVTKETMVDMGLEYNRKYHENGNYYFITNWSDENVDGFVPIDVDVKSVIIYDPMTGQKGQAKLESNDETKVYLQLNPGESIILATYDIAFNEKPYPYYQKSGEAITLDNQWKVSFEKGGPQLQKDQTISELSSWTEFAGEDGKSFSGTASYQTTFDRSVEAAYWKLDLGEVKESARVILNGKEIGTLIGPEFEIVFSDSLLQDKNQLMVKVANLMANRIAHMDKEGVKWKKFYNVNFPARKRENVKNGIFDASAWEPLSSGLLGPVTLTPMKKE